MPRTASRRPCCAAGANSPACATGRRGGRGFTASPPASASTPYARAGGGKPCSAPASMRSSRERGRGSNRGRAGFRRPALNAGRTSGWPSSRLLHGLSPRARAVLLLHDGVGMTAAEAAAVLGISVAAARSALQRARTALPPQDVVAADDAPVEAYVDAWNAGDVGALIGLLQRDIVLTMPPWHRTLTGRDEVARFMTGVWPRYDGFRAVAVVANGQPAAAVYTRRDDAPYLPHSLHVLAGSGQVGEVVLYAPPLGASLFAAFGLRPAGLID